MAQPLHPPDATLQRYQSLKQTRVPLLCLSALGVGVPLIVIWLLNRKMKRVRDHARNCPNCGKPMEKLPEDKDNDYLTPAQDTEERINSVDYDVWLCRACGETDIIPYVNDRSAYTVCPRCNARACQLTADRIVIQPTVAREGQGVKVYTCRNCGFQNNRPYRIPRRQPPVVIIPPGGGSGFGSGGGFSGGSFGGGLKYSYGHALYVLDLDERAKGLQLLTLSHSQFKDLDERKFKLWQKKLAKNPDYPCPVCSVRDAYPVEIEKKKNGGKTEYLVSIDNESDTDILSKEELSALLSAPRIPDIIYRYSRYQAEATVEYLK